MYNFEGEAKHGNIGICTKVCVQTTFNGAIKSTSSTQSKTIMELKPSVTQVLGEVQTHAQVRKCFPPIPDKYLTFCFINIALSEADAGYTWF